VLAIGLQGNLRKLGVPGEDLSFVQYQLDDPEDYAGETIVIIGAGDSAIENALALALQNTVIIVNRRDEFNRAKEGNLKAVLRAIDAGSIQCMHQSAPLRVESVEAPGSKPGVVVLKSPESEAAVACDRVIARLGAAPPRRFVESCGVTFPNKDPNAVPALSDRYESNVRGLYVIGALAGYPLIKQAMNQGYEVIEYIEGRAVEPADEPVLREKFRVMPQLPNVSVALAMITRNIPVLSGLTTLQLREFLLDSQVLAPKPGDILFRHKDYSNTLFCILHGAVVFNRNPTPFHE
ncbi:MAG: NAD(P)-binding domain-containing protein, partial [Gammaproteobacteria bacterium]|nr:NAD(P)-binding domain-containing protein [Gammaproteobacteria bacterium]